VELLKRFILSNSDASISNTPISHTQSEFVVDIMTSIKLKTPVTGEYEQPTGLYVDIFLN
jgi:hypothetical protein